MNDRKKIIIGSDHAGFEMKHSIISNLSDIEFDDIGTDSDESVDYPDYAHNVVKGILSNVLIYIIKFVKSTLMASPFKFSI